MSRNFEFVLEVVVIFRVQYSKPGKERQDPVGIVAEVSRMLTTVLYAGGRPRSGRKATNVAMRRANRHQAASAKPGAWLRQNGALAILHRF